MQNIRRTNRKKENNIMDRDLKIDLFPINKWGII